MKIPTITTPDCLSRLLEEAQHEGEKDLIRSDKALVIHTKNSDHNVSELVSVYGNEIDVRHRAICRLANAGFVKIISENFEFVTAIWTKDPNPDAYKIIMDDDQKLIPYIVTLHETVQRQIIVYGKSPDDVLADVYKQVEDGKISRLDRRDDLHANLQVGCPFIASDGSVAHMFRKNLIARDPDGAIHDTNESKERFV